eukprot:scaffold1469_cov119-Cylindrotheca_fusiformis.AAC.36
MKRIIVRSSPSIPRHYVLQHGQSTTTDAGRVFLNRSRFELPNARSPPVKKFSSCCQQNFSRPVMRRSMSSNVDTVWRQTSARLLETPPTAFDDDKTRTECHLAVLWWLKNGGKVEGIQMAFQLLDHVNLYAEFGEEVDGVEEIFTTDLLNLVVNHWRKSAAGDPSLFKSHPDLSPRELLNKMMTFHSSGSAILKPDIHTFTMIIDGASNNGDVDVGESTLQWLLLQAAGDKNLRPNVITFSSLMNCWAKSKLPEAPEKVEALVEQMHELKTEEPDWEVAPNQVTYTTAIDCWAQRGRADRVEALLKEMYQEYSNGNNDLRPNLPAFNGYLVALAKGGDVDKAQSVLEQMERLYESDQLDERPSVISYSTVLSSFANSDVNGAGERAEAILRRMIDQGIPPNTISYNSVINSYTKSRQMDRAENLLKEMHEASMHGDSELRPSVQTYTLVLSGWSKAKSPVAGERGERILGMMKSLANSGELDSAPDIVAYNAVLDCWCKSRSDDAVNRAWSLFESMSREGVEPDAYSYNILIRTLTRAGKLKDADKLFQSMSDGMVEPDVTTYNTMLDAWSKSSFREAPGRVVNLFSRIKSHERIRPDNFTYNILLNYYGKAGNGQQAESLLDEMCHPGSRVKADTVSFNTVIAAWSRARQADAPMRAESILEKMLNAGGRIRPNSISFNTVMGAWVRSKSPHAFENCERLFSRMMELAESGNSQLKPDVVTYNTLIQACSLSSLQEAPDRAESILNEMKRKLKPNAMTYGAMIGVWSKSNRNDAGEKATAALRELVNKLSSGKLEGGLRVFEFTATIRAWEKSGSPDALSRADEILHLLLQQQHNGHPAAMPDSFLFNAILRLLASSNIPDKPKYADRLLQLMRDYEVKPTQSNLQLLKICYDQHVQEIAS